MSKNTLWGGMAFLVVVLGCGLPFFARAWFVPHPTAIQPPSPAYPSPAAATVVPASLLAPKQEDTDAEQAGRKGMQTDNRELKLANSALEAALQKAEADKKRVEANTESMVMLTGKLLDGSLKVPHTTAEAGSLAGRNLFDAAKFKQKWGDSIPVAGTPEADEYALEKEVLVSGSAAFLKFMADEKNTTLLAQPDSIAQFQAGSLAGALDLRDDQVQGISTVLDGYYRQFYAQGLDSAAQPQTGLDVWQQQRIALSRQSYAAVSAFLTPEQAAAFQRIYPPAGSWMLTATIADVPGLQEN